MQPQLSKQSRKKGKKVTLHSDFIQQQENQYAQQESQIDYQSNQSVQKTYLRGSPSKQSPILDNSIKSKGSMVRLKPNKLPGITISRAQREINKLILVDGPGPSSYQAKKLDNSHGIKFPKSSGHNWNEQKYANKIGPGKYNHEVDNQSKKCNYTMGYKYESIFQVGKKMAPGPGEYANTVHHPLLSKSKSKSINKGFGTSNRFQEQEKVRYPGPGDYEILLDERKSINKKRSISNVGRQALKQQKKPGPAQYQKASNFDQALKKKKGITIGLKNNRSSLPNITMDSYNKYTIYREFESQKTPAYSIGNQKRKFFDISTTPSPQDYKVQHAYPHSPSAIIPASMEKNINKIVPGPGAYELSKNELLESGVRYSFGKSKSNSIADRESEIPGVGKYSIDLQNSKLTQSRGPVFGKQKKMKQESKFKVGVGDYDLRSEWGQRKGPTIPRAIINN